MNIFQKIIAKEVPAKIVYEDDLCLAFHDIDPQAPVHILLVPKKEIRSLALLTEKETTLMGHLLVKAAEIARKLGIEKDGYRVVMNTNAQAGQTVFHLHLHILGGRVLRWPPG